ncbi:sugar ABC transporter ATP-binding protein [Pseudarthrobacter sp. HLT3-5]|uniref:sugar ABC transporter ATP-binding protein n=1 Tax=Pseudarthrobacter cellobiosi TaxID=2953654 RepID=UPI00208FB2D3|nr:sugar ABC transporter ATP-binding protein [Pseudarthrobacter sp. HLT3-5]MCO4273289.1 sugar ABC transporter ATP-binding protein [Pseudarthrobacter sp. HLT3-5]
MHELTGPHTPALTLRGISKKYADVQVLTDIDLDVRAGEAVGLLGQNGAGKSTLIKIISGVEKPSQGLIFLDGAPADFRSTHEAQNAGIATIHQEIILVPQMSVAENLCLSNLPHKGAVLDRRALYQEARNAITALGFDIDVRSPADTLTAAQKQVVLIAKALRQKAKILLLDEPTATLPAPDVAKLFELLRKLKQEGTGIIYISHRIDEMYEICDHIMVLRDGKHVMTEKAASFPRQDAVRKMLGSDPVSSLEPSQDPSLEPLLEPSQKWNFARAKGERHPDGAHPAFEVLNLSDPELLDNVTLRVRPGESIAVTGLVGSGQSELAACLFGDRKFSSGHVYVDGKKLRSVHPRALIAAGVGWVPDDRKTQGLVLNMDLSENFSMANLRMIAPHGWLQRKLEKRIADKAIKTLKVKCQGSGQQVGRLSGGNQQKVVVGKWLTAKAKVLLLSEPTRGIDVAAREDIYKEINAFLDAGGSVIVFSSEIEEALMCHRIYVMGNGAVVAEFDQHDTDLNQVMSLLR